MRVGLLVIAVVASIGAVIGGIAAFRGDDEESVYVREHPVEVPREARLVVVSETMPMPSAHERRLSAMLEAGDMIRHPTTGEVLTDTDCVPDSQGISRCRNEVRLANGRTIVLRHPHNMAAIPCLAPGETVRLLPASA